jgi:transcriptional regulator with XRE-family HTH domain
MQDRIDRELDRRRETLRTNYFYIVGAIIRQARLALGMTQAILARGICSNTYISKIENSQIEPNWETVFRIAEKAHVYPYIMEIPRRMLDNLSECLDYFLAFDQASYKAFLDKLSGYDFGVALDIMKFGYSLLVGDLKEAKKTYEYGHHFFRNMDDFGFSLFLLFSSEYLIQIRDFKAARDMLDRVEKNERFFLLCPELYHELRYITYERLGDTLHAKRHFDAAKALYVIKENERRIHRLSFWQDGFETLSNGIVKKDRRFAQDAFMPQPQYDEWMLELATAGDAQAASFVAQWNDDHPLKSEALVLEALQENGGLTGAAASKLKAIRDAVPNRPDYYGLLEARDQGDKALEREKVVSLMIARAHRLQSIQELKRWYRRASELSYRMKRYKDSARYLATLSQLLDEYRIGNAVESKENRPQDDADDELLL